jgi:CrcB protein
MTRFLLVCAGGAAGTAARYLTALWAGATFGPAFPFGTLIVNVAGSFLIALVMHIGITTEWISNEGARGALFAGEKDVRALRVLLSS